MEQGSRFGPDISSKPRWLDPKRPSSRHPLSPRRRSATRTRKPQSTTAFNARRTRRRERSLNGAFMHPSSREQSGARMLWLYGRKADRAGKQDAESQLQARHFETSAVGKTSARGNPPFLPALRRNRPWQQSPSARAPFCARAGPIRLEPPRPIRDVSADAVVHRLRARLALLHECGASQMPQPPGRSRQPCQPVRSARTTNIRNTQRRNWPASAVLKLRAPTHWPASKAGTMTRQR